MFVRYSFTRAYEASPFLSSLNIANSLFSVLICLFCGVDLQGVLESCNNKYLAEYCYFLTYCEEIICFADGKIEL